jgi:sec-independent protein translocase protein TatC
MTDDEKTMSFIAHLEELRIRLIKILIGIGVGFLLCYFVSDELFNMIARPIQENMPKGGSLIIIKLQEGFFTYLKISLISGLFLTSPFSFYQIWLFVAPGLYKHEKRYVIPFVMLATFFFVGGAAFCYFVVLPFGIKFFLNYTAAYVQPNISIQSYFNLVIGFVLSFGVIFELPVIMIFLAKIGLVDVKTFTRNRKYSILMAFIIGAVFTPTPDAVNQCLMAVPLILLYEIGIFFVWLIVRNENKKKVPEDA